MLGHSGWGQCHVSGPRSLPCDRAGWHAVSKALGTEERTHCLGGACTCKCTVPISVSLLSRSPGLAGTRQGHSWAPLSSRLCTQPLGGAGEMSPRSLVLSECTSEPGDRNAGKSWASTQAVSQRHAPRGGGSAGHAVRPPGDPRNLHRGSVQIRPWEGVPESGLGQHTQHTRARRVSLPCHLRGRDLRGVPPGTPCLPRNLPGPRCHSHVGLRRDPPRLSGPNAPASRPETSPGEARPVHCGPAWTTDV